MEIFRVKTDIPFMKFRKISAIISTSIFIASILFLVTRGLNLGVDFTGGTLMEVSYPQAANLEEIRSTLKKIDLPEAQVQNFGTSSDVLIRLPVVENLSLADLSEKIALTLK
jgi:preprotein translocase subunit SecF